MAAASDSIAGRMFTAWTFGFLVGKGKVGSGRGDRRSMRHFRVVTRRLELSGPWITFRNLPQPSATFRKSLRVERVPTFVIAVRYVIGMRPGCRRKNIIFILAETA